MPGRPPREEPSHPQAEPAATARWPGVVARPAFTLLEMMLVVVIIGILATVVVYNLTGQTTSAMRGATVASMSQIKSALAQYYSRYGAFPVTLQPLAAPPNPILEKIPKDGWKRDFFYLWPAQEPGKDFTLISRGKDGQLGTADDINVWTMDEQQ